MIHWFQEGPVSERVES